MLKHSVVFVFFINYAVQAEIITDGTLGNRVNLSAPDFQITQDLGQRVGDNLFHSFEQFNVFQGETATFSGDVGIQNVISRVTGGQLSTIDGTLRNTIPNADTYLLNPAGVLFGENAQLDVQGSFHVSTADYLRLGEDGRFSARNPASSVLTVAPPEAFGFLDASVAPITVDKSYLQVIAPTEALVSAIREGSEIPSNTLALIGGDITIHGETTVQHDSVIPQGILLSFAGEVDLVSVASKGEVLLDPLHLAEDTFSQLGTVQITDTTQGDANFYRFLGNIDTTGPHSGKVNILADTLLLDNAYIFSDTFGDQNGHGINIQVRDAIKLENTARITADVFKQQGFPSEATGNASDIHISARDITLQSGSQITSNSLTLNNDSAQGNAGTIALVASDQITITGYSQLVGESESGRMNSGILTDTQTVGQGGEIAISTNKLIMDDVGEIRANTSGLGDAGNISLQVGTLSLNNGAQINVSAGHAGAGLPIDTGKGGQLHIEASEEINITGEKEDGFYRPSGLFSNTFSNSQGGTITLEAPQLTLENKGTIQTSTAGNGGDAGDINIEANYLRMQDANLTMQAKGSDQGGKIFITAPTVELQKQALISSESMGSGNAGDIEINSDNVTLEQAYIMTRAEDAEGGNVSITCSEHITIGSGSSISVSALGLDVQSGGGNITFKCKYIVACGSQLNATAVGGAGGNIHFVVEEFEFDIKNKFDIKNPGNNILFNVKGYYDECDSVDNYDLSWLGSSEINRLDVTFDTYCKEYFDAMIDLEKEFNPSTFYVHHSWGSRPMPDDYQGLPMPPMEELF